MRVLKNPFHQQSNNISFQSEAIRYSPLDSPSPTPNHKQCTSPLAFGHLELFQNVIMSLVGVLGGSAVRFLAFQHNF